MAIQQNSQDPYFGLPTLDDALRESPDKFNEISSRFYELSRLGADRGMVQREAKRIGYAPIALDQNGAPVDMTDFVARRAEMSVGEQIQDVAAGMGRGIVSLPADIASIASIPIQAATGYTGVADFAQGYRSGVNELIPTSNKYRQSTAEGVGGGISSVLSMAAGGAGLAKLGVGVTSKVVAKEAAKEAAQRAAFAAATAKNALRIATVQGAGSEAGAAQAAGAGPGAQAIAAAGGAAAAQLERFGAERIIRDIMSPAMAGARFTGRRAAKQVGAGFAGEVGEELVAAPIITAARSGYEEAPFTERVGKELEQTIKVAPLAIMPFSAIHGMRAYQMVRRDTMLAEKLPDVYAKRTGTLEQLSAVPENRQLEKNILTIDQLRDQGNEEAAEELQMLSSRSGTPLVASSPSTERVAALGEMLAQSGVRVAYFEPIKTEGVEEENDVAGFYDPRTATVYVNSSLPEGAQIMQGLVNEIMHDLHKDSPGGLAQVHERLRSAFGETYENYMKRVAERYGEYEAGSQELTEEQVNNFLTQGMAGYLGLAFTNQDVFKYAAYNDPGLLSTVAETFTRFMGLSVDKYNQRDQAILSQRLENIAAELNRSFMGDPTAGAIDPNTAIRVANEIVLGMQNALEVRASFMPKIREALRTGPSETGKPIVAEREGGRMYGGRTVVLRNRARSMAAGALTKEEYRKLYPEGQYPAISKDIVITEDVISTKEGPDGGEVREIVFNKGEVVARAGDQLTPDLASKLRSIPRQNRSGVEYSKEDIISKYVDRAFRVDRIVPRFEREYGALSAELRRIQGRSGPVYEPNMSADEAEAAAEDQQIAGIVFRAKKKQAEVARRLASDEKRRKQEEFERAYAEELRIENENQEAKKRQEYEAEFKALMEAEQQEKEAAEARRKEGMDDAHAKAMFYFASRRHIVAMKAELRMLRNEAAREGKGSNQSSERQLQLEYAIGEYYKLEQEVKALFKEGFQIDENAPPSVSGRYRGGDYRLEKEFKPRPGETELQTEVRTRELLRSRELSDRISDLEDARNKILGFIERVKSTASLSNVVVQQAALEKLPDDKSVLDIAKRALRIRTKIVDLRRSGGASQLNKAEIEANQLELDIALQDLNAKAVEYRRRAAELIKKRRESRKQGGQVEPPRPKRKNDQGEDEGGAGPVEPEPGPAGPAGPQQPSPPERPGEGGGTTTEGQVEGAQTAEEALSEGQGQQEQQQEQQQEEQGEEQAQTAEESIAQGEEQAGGAAETQQAEQPQTQQQPQAQQQQAVVTDENGNWQPGAPNRIIRGGVPGYMTAEKAKAAWVRLQALMRKLNETILDAKAKGKLKGRYAARLDNKYRDMEKDAATFSRFHWAFTGKFLDGPEMADEMSELVEDAVRNEGYPQSEGQSRQRRPRQVRSEARKLDQSINDIALSPENRAALAEKLEEKGISKEEARQAAEQASSILPRWFKAISEYYKSLGANATLDKESSKALGGIDNDSDFYLSMAGSLESEYFEAARGHAQIEDHPGLKESGILERIRPAQQAAAQQPTATQQQTTAQQQPQQQPQQQQPQQQQPQRQAQQGQEPKPWSAGNPNFYSWHTENGIIIRAGVPENVILSNREEVPVVYAIVDVSEIVPTHSPAKGFKKNPGADLNERPYEDPKAGESLRKGVVRMAGPQRFRADLMLNTDPTAVTGPPIVTDRGIVLGGNARAMAMGLLYSNAGSQVLRDAVKKFAEDHGVAVEFVDAIKNPVVVRIIKPGNEGTPGSLSAALNESLTAAKDTASRSASRGSRLTVATIDAISRILEDGESVRSALNNPAKAAEIEALLARDYVLTEKDLVEMKVDGKFTAAAKEEIEKAIVGSVVDDISVLSNMKPNTSKLVAASAGQLLRIISADPSSKESIKNAVSILNYMDSSDTRFSELDAQSLIGDVEGAQTWRGDEYAKDIAKVLTLGQIKGKAVLQSIASAAIDSASGQGSMFATDYVLGDPAKTARDLMRREVESREARRGSIQPNRLMYIQQNKLSTAETTRPGVAPEPDYERAQQGAYGFIEKVYTAALDRFEAVRAVERNIARAADNQAKKAVDADPDAPAVERAIYNSTTMNVSEMLDLYTGRIGENNKLAMEHRQEMIDAAKEYDIPVSRQEGESSAQVSADEMLYASHAKVANRTLLEDRMTEKFDKSEEGIRIRRESRRINAAINKEMKSDDRDEDLISELENELGDLEVSRDELIAEMVNEAFAAPAKIRSEMKKLSSEKPVDEARAAEINTKLNDLSMSLEAAESITSLSGMTNEEADELNRRVAASGKADGYKRIREAMTKLQNMKLKIMVDSELVSPSMAAKWKERYGPTYIPLKSTIRDPDGSSFSGGGGISIKGSESKVRRGRKDYADDIIAHSLVDFSQANSRANRNLVARTLFNLIQSNRINQNWTFLGSDLKKAKQSGQFNTRDKERLISVKVTQPKKLGGGTKTVELYAVVHSEDLARAVRQLDGIDLGNFTAGAVYATRIFTRMQTAWNPAFILPNFARDIALATGVRYADGGAKASLRLLKNIPSAVRTILAVELGQTKIGSALGFGNMKPGKFSVEYDEMKRLGGFSSPVDYGTVEEQMRRFKKEAQKTGKSKAGNAVVASASAIRSFFDFIEAVNTVTERATRLAAYVEMDTTLNEANPKRIPGLDKAKRAAAAKNMTVNFDRRGTAGPVLNSLYAFYNANAQGTANLVRRLGPNAPSDVRLRSGIAVSAFAIAGYALSALARATADDDEEGESAYKSVGLDEMQKSAILMIPGAGSTRVTMPLPWGANMAWFMGVQLERMAAGDIKGAEAADQYVGGLLTSFSPITGPTASMALVPTLARPFAEIDANINYAGNAIMPPMDPYDKTPLPDSRRSYRTVGGHYKFMAETMNDITGGSARVPGFIDISPESLEHLGEFLSGGTGRFIANAFGSGLTKEDIKIRDIPVAGPIAGRFVRQSDKEQRTMSEFYSNAAKVAQYREDIKDPETRDEAIQSNLGQVSRYASAAESKIRKFREMENLARARGDQDRAAKLKESRLAIMSAFNRRYNQVASK